MPVIVFMGLLRCCGVLGLAELAGVGMRTRSGGHIGSSSSVLHQVRRT
jgi:hypothetical protein